MKHGVGCVRLVYSGGNSLQRNSRGTERSRVPSNERLFHGGRCHRSITTPASDLTTLPGRSLLNTVLPGLYLLPL